MLAVVSKQLFRSEAYKGGSAITWLWKMFGGLKKKKTEILNFVTSGF